MSNQVVTQNGNGNGGPRRGRPRGAGVPEAEMFAQQWPIGSTLSGKDFDTWAASVGAYTTRGYGQDYINRVRAAFRYKINNAARGSIFLQRGAYPPYQIEILDHGNSLEVIAAPEAHRRKTKRLPRKVESVFDTNWGLVQELRSTIDVKQIPEVVKMALSQVDYGLQVYERDIRQTVSNAKSDLDRFVYTLEQAVATTPELANNPSVQALIASHKPQEEPTEEQLYEELFGDDSEEQGGE